MAANISSMSKHHNPRIDLGIAVAHHRLAKPGVVISHKSIAAYCDCTWNYIWLIEQRALHKLKRMAYLRNDPAMRALVESLGR